MTQPAQVPLSTIAHGRNALSRGLIDALTAAFQQARADAAARCVILTATGPAFCAGMDLAELAESVASTGRDPGAGASIWDDVLQLATLYDLIYTLPKP